MLNRSRRRRRLLLKLSASLSALLLLLPQMLHAAIVNGTVTDPLGAAVPHATVALIQKGKVVAHAVSGSDGTYQINSSASGRFYILASAGTFKQITTQSFYAGPVDARQMNVVLEPQPVHQEVVVSATGVPTPQAQVSASTSVVRTAQIRDRIGLTDALRQMPGVFLVQQGQYGGLTSLFLRGGNSSANKVNLDGVPIEDIGGNFDFSNVGTMGVEKAEVYRGPNSVVYGSDAGAGVVDLTTPRGSTPFPSLIYEGDGGDFGTFRNQLQLGGTLSKLDYYGGFSAFQSANALPMDEYHDDTSVANLGFDPTAASEFRVTARNSDSATGLPGAYEFYDMSNAGKQSDQDTYLSGVFENQTSRSWHNLVRYGMVRKREEDTNFYPAGIPIATTSDGYTSTNYYGYNTTFTGANGDSATGQALLNYTGTYPNTTELVSNRDQLYFESDFHFPKHIVGLFGFRFEDERGAEKSIAYAIDQTLERANYDYTGQIQGEFRRRVYYTVGGGVEKNQLYGTVGTPRMGLAYYPVRPGKGIFHGTKITFNFAKGYQEPTLDDQFGSLYSFLLNQPGGEQAIGQFHVLPIGAEQARSYDGGGEQNFLNEHGVLRVTYFHNEFGNQIESVPPSEVPTLLPNLSPDLQQSLESYLANSYGIDLNSQAFRAQGFETAVDFSLLRNLVLRGGYTYLDAVVQRSFTSDALAPSYNSGLPGGPAPSFAGTPIGAFDPLRGARPFRRPPHTGFSTITFTGSQLSLEFTGAYASRSDDSTFLAADDLAGGNSLLLPNRNLDYGYAKLDAGGSFQLFKQLAIYAQVTNLTSDHHIGPIGYPALPFTYRAGLRITVGHGSK